MSIDTFLSRVPLAVSSSMAPRTASAIPGEQSSQKCSSHIPRQSSLASRPCRPSTKPSVSSTPGSMVPKAMAASSTVRASGPGVSQVGANGTMPSIDQRPIVTFRPTLPVTLAGMRTEPPVSVPMAINADPSHKLTPAPDDDPPETRCWTASHGLRGAPQWALVPTAPKANSTVWVLPGTTHIAPRKARVTGPSRRQSPGNSVGPPP